jgi:hypothetical protein
MFRGAEEQHAHLTFKALLAVKCTAKFNCISTQCIIIPTKKSRYFPIQHPQTGLFNEARCIMCEIRTECVYIRCRLTGVFNKAVLYLRRLIAGLSPRRSTSGRSTCHLHVNSTLIRAWVGDVREFFGGIKGQWTQNYFHLAFSSSNCYIVTHIHKIIQQRTS